MKGFKVEDYTKYETSDKPFCYNWKDLNSLLCKLDADRSTLEIIYNKEWDCFNINDKVTMEDYTLKWGTNKKLLEIEVDTENEKGECTVFLEFGLK